MKRSLILAFLVVAVAIPATGNASADGCGGAWETTASCGFVYEGGGLFVTGSVGSAAGMGVFTVEADGPAAGAPPLVLGGCPAVGVAGSACGFVTTSPLIDIPTGTLLTCRAAGIGSGTYECGNATSA